MRRPAYNSADRIVEENRIAIDDLCAAPFRRLAEIQRPADVHSTHAGDEALGERVTASIRAALNREPGP